MLPKEFDLSGEDSYVFMFYVIVYIHDTYIHLVVCSLHKEVVFNLWDLQRGPT